MKSLLGSVALHGAVIGIPLWVYEPVTLTNHLPCQNCVSVQIVDRVAPPTPRRISNGRKARRSTSDKKPNHIVERTHASIDGHLSAIYPEEARKKGDEGKVVLRVRIDKSGGSLGVDVIESSGHPALDAAGLEAAKNARFVPAFENGQAIQSTKLLAFVFRLNSKVQ